MPEKFEGEKPQEQESKEQISEKIIKDLERAMEKNSEALLTVLNPDGESSREGIVIPEFFEDDVLWVTTQDGQGIAIEIYRIKKVELPDEQAE